MSLFRTSIKHYTGGLSQCNKARKRIENHIDWEKGSKTVLIHMTMYVKYPKESTKRLL